MTDLYTIIDLRLGHSQSNYFRQSKARNVNWEKARRLLDGLMETLPIDDEY